MEKQIRDQQSKAQEEKRKQQGLADFESDEKDDGIPDKNAKDQHTEAEPLAPFRRSGEPGSRK